MRMSDTEICALDFDGVICDSAVETGITGWKAAIQLWPDMPGDEVPAKQLLDQFRLVRPVLETGYEAILIMRLLYQGENPLVLMTDFDKKIQNFINHEGLEISYLKNLFCDTRDIWIKQDASEWIGMNPIFPSIADKLRKLDSQCHWYITTTKQERFVEQILLANQVHLSTERIYGLDRNLSKQDVLLMLMNQHTKQDIYFIEDRLPTLINVSQNKQLERVKLYLASWGYNTEQDRQSAAKQGIEVINRDEFLSNY